MTRTEAIQRLEAEAEALRALGIATLHLFGSTAAGTASARSDLDVFVEADPSAKFSLFDLAGVKLLLEEKLGLEADVVTRGSLHPLLRDAIERSAVRVF